MPLKNCLNCNQVFEAPQGEINRGNGKFCSRICCGTYKRKTHKPLPSNQVCAYCQAPFRRKNSQPSKSGLYFCCRKHKDLAQRLNGGLEEIQPSHYGLGNGLSSYRKAAFEIYNPECAKCGYKKYQKVLQVHHKDGNRLNNPLDGSNWEILCPTHHKEADLKLRGFI